MKGRPTGSIEQRGKTYRVTWYDAAGERRRKSGFRTRKDAGDWLRTKLKAIYQATHGSYGDPTVAQLLDRYLDGLELDGAKSIRETRRHAKVVRQAFGERRYSTITADELQTFARDLRRSGLAAATTNRKLEPLTSALRLAHRDGLIGSVLNVPRLKMDNRRMVRPSPEQVEAILANLPSMLRDYMLFESLIGWRKGMTSALEWSMVRRDAGHLQLPDSKSGDAVGVEIFPALADILDRRWADREFTRRDGTTGLSVYVFHRFGKPVKDYRRRWRRACAEAGVSGMAKDGVVPHDLRRYAAINLRRAGVDEPTAMSILGHKTSSMFRRYSITDGTDQRRAFDRLQQHLDEERQERAGSKVVPLRRRSS